MKFDTKQCAQCPFRKKSLPGWLGSYDAASIFRGAWDGEPFFCHTMIEGKDGRGYEKKGWAERALRNGKLCTGGLAFANLIPAPMRSPHVQVLKGRLRMKTIQVECMGPNEFREHHDMAKTKTIAPPKPEPKRIEPADGPCRECGKPTKADQFCFGCKTLVCEKCDISMGNTPMGSHDWTAHLESPDGFERDEEEDF